MKAQIGVLAQQVRRHPGGLSVCGNLRVPNNGAGLQLAGLPDSIYLLLRFTWAAPSWIVIPVLLLWLAPHRVTRRTMAWMLGCARNPDAAFREVGGGRTIQCLAARTEGP